MLANGLWFDPRSLEQLSEAGAWARGLMLYRQQRVLGLEITAVDPRDACPVAGGPDAACNATARRCRLHRGAAPLCGSCPACGPFVVSHHGIDFESIFLRLGFTFLETLPEQVRAWTEAHPREVVSLLGLLSVHDGSGGAVRVEDVMQRLGTAGLLPRVWNHERRQPAV